MILFLLPQTKLDLSVDNIDIICYNTERNVIISNLAKGATAVMYILAFDQGTTSSRSIIFDTAGNALAVAQLPLKQYYPKPGYVEHDPKEILSAQLETARVCIEKLGEKPSCIGITNQRETVTLWNKHTGKPVFPAIVWQCRRTADICERLKAGGHADYIKQTTGLPVDAYFSGTKISWILENVEGVREAALRGDILCGTVDSWLIWNLTGKHMTDITNASRTMLFDIHRKCWDDKLCEILGIPMNILPEVAENIADFGSVIEGENIPKELVGIPICASAGDQHAALFGQTCYTPGDVKNTYGTGCFTLMNTGETPVSSQNLITTIGWSYSGKTVYALEGSVFNAGSAIQWLRDELKMISSSREADILAESVPDCGGVTCVPAFTGLGSPYWDMYARGSILGLTRGSSRAHICRAVLEGIAFQVYDLISEMEKDSGNKIKTLYVDGGASVSNFMMQFQSDILGIKVDRPANVETTALGAAMMAALGAGLVSEDSLTSLRETEREFHPLASEKERDEHTNRWKKAVCTTQKYEF